jgi:hypothetical protein
MKHKLTLAELEVHSFEAGKDGFTEERGTVRGHDATGSATCDGSLECSGASGATCSPTCWRTCQFTCQYSCDFTCPNGCH